jgi:hypothetical protein
MDSRLLDWLGVDERGIGYHLYFLTLRFTKSPEALARLRETAHQLEHEPDYWQQIIDSSVWRPQLVGCCALLITQNRAYLPALISGIRRHTFVSPQMAVTLGLLHPADTLPYLEQLLLSPNIYADPKRTTAVYQALSKLGSSAATAFDAVAFRENPPSGYSESHWRMDCDVGMGVTHAHWEAWRQILLQEAT